jgi:homoserine O-acetyltransferase
MRPALARGGVVAALALGALALAVAARAAPQVAEADATFRDVRFASGETLPELRLHYRTLGAPVRDAGGVVRNAVLLLHGTGGSGAQFLQPQFADEMFGPGQLLDAGKYFIVMPDNVGHGGSSKPSDGLRMTFPHYAYADMVRLQHRLLTEHLKVTHLRLVMGTSMGGMHAWMWGYLFPDAMDGLVPLASVPTAIAGRNRMWRRMLMDAIVDDPGWRKGEYAVPPILGLRAAVRLQMILASAPIYWQSMAPTREAADAFIDQEIDKRAAALDANDTLYHYDASRDYDPSPHLESIAAPVLAINSADDQVNPPELGLMETLLARVKQARYVLIPASVRTRGHSSHTVAVLWKDEFAAFVGALPER